jgi:hypothetical protein
MSRRVKPPVEVLPRGAGSSGTAIASRLRRVRRLAIGDAANRLISSILGPLGPNRSVVRWILTLVFTGNRERLAGVQGAAMSPLVAGTMPAKSGMEAPGLSPSRRPGPVVSPGRSSPGQRGTCALECDVPSSVNSSLSSSSEASTIPAPSGEPPACLPVLSLIHLPPFGLPSRATVAGGFTPRPTLRAGTVFYPC